MPKMKWSMFLSAPSAPDVSDCIAPSPPRRSQTFRWTVSRTTWRPKRSCCSGPSGWWRDTRACAATTSPPAGGMANSSTPSYTNTGEADVRARTWELQGGLSQTMWFKEKGPHGDLFFSNHTELFASKSLSGLGVEYNLQLERSSLWPFAVSPLFIAVCSEAGMPNSYLRFTAAHLTCRDKSCRQVIVNQTEIEISSVWLQRSTAPIQ